VKCDESQKLIDRFFQELDPKLLNKIRGHLGGCPSCRARYSALYMAETSLGSRKIPQAAGQLLQDDDKERVVDAVAHAPKVGQRSNEEEAPIRAGIWISIVLASLAIALLILLTQGPTPKRGQRLSSMQSKAALAVDLYCLGAEKERYR